MKNFGYKIVDKNIYEFAAIVKTALQEGRPLEIGCYFNEIQAKQFLRSNLANHALINTHLNHRRHNIFEIHTRFAEVEETIKEHISMGSSYSVTHIGIDPIKENTDISPDLVDHLVRNLHKLEGICERHDYQIYIENTCDSLTLFRTLFARIEESKLKTIHFCFDIGHAKVWDNSPLSDWLLFVTDLRARGFQLHFHLHCNDGINDKHWSLQEADEKVDHIRTNEYETAIKRIHEDFPDSRKIFEVQTDLALDNLELTMHRSIFDDSSKPGLLSMASNL